MITKSNLKNMLSQQVLVILLKINTKKTIRLLIALS